MQICSIFTILEIKDTSCNTINLFVKQFFQQHHQLPQPIRSVNIPNSEAEDGGECC